jgi:hypothetical protein
MAQRNKRCRGVYRSDRRFVSSVEIEGTIYNAFPYISTNELIDGKRAFYFPTIRGIYMPPEKIGRDFHSLFEHEYTHRVVSDVVATCEIQFLIYFFLGMMMDFLADPECKILIPSFTVKLSNEETNDFLIKLANEIDELNFTTGLVHEIVANAVQAQFEGWDRETTKEKIQLSLNEFCIGCEHEEFVDDCIECEHEKFVETS